MALIKAMGEGNPEIFNSLLEYSAVRFGRSRREVDLEIARRLGGEEAEREAAAEEVVGEGRDFIAEWKAKQAKIREQEIEKRRSEMPSVPSIGEGEVLPIAKDDADTEEVEIKLR